MKPSINASMEDLKRQMAKGGQHGSSPGSSGNIMPGPNAAMGSSMGRAPSGGGSSSLMGIPSRTGAYNPVQGSYMPTLGSPTSHAVTPGSVPAKQLGGASNANLTHGRTIAAVNHLAKHFGDHPHLQKAMSHAKMHFSKMKSSAPMKSFGSLGGMAGSMPGKLPNMDSNVVRTAAGPANPSMEQDW